MCGIAGFYGFRNDDLIKKISLELEHRGPDGEGFFINDDVTLLNRRLAIIDLKGGDQPIYNEDKSICVVYNGEIFNYQELRKTLEKFGHNFKTESDTEVIVHGYEQWGEKCFDMFNGMFAIALYDIKNKKLLLVRDHFGIKPLYYSVIDTNIIFASEIKPIINSGLIEKKPNDRIIYRYLKYRVHDDNQETFFENVYKLMPGELMVVSSKGQVVRKYSNLEKDLINNVETHCNASLQKKNETQFKSELIRAITYRLISDVPVGTCLSGGLDSSTVVAVVNKLLKEKKLEAKSIGINQKSYSAVFPGSRNDEEKYVDEVIKFVGTGHCPVRTIKIFPKPEEFFKDLEDFVRTQEEPTISTGPYAQYKVMERAHQDVKVLLDGQGSDEMMAGYLPYYFVYIKQLIRERRVMRVVGEVWGMKDVLIKFLFQKKSSLPNLLNIEFSEKWKKEKFVTINDNLKARLVEDVFHNSLPSLLRYEDKNAMRFSIEGRVPFMDFNLIRFIFSLSDSEIINDGWNKYILRQSVRELLPKMIVDRRNKIGFTTPEQEWFLRMKNKIYSIFMSESFVNRKYFNQAKVIKAFQQFIEGKNDDTMVFWRMLNLEMWLQIFFDEKSLNVLKVKKVLKEEIIVEGKKYLRYPIRTELFKRDDDYVKKISEYVTRSINRSSQKKVNFLW